MPIPAFIPAAIAGAQLIGGLIGRFTAKRPKREIPESAKRTLAISQIQAASPYAPGYGQAREGVDVSAANALAAAQASGNVAAAIQGIVGQRQAANRDLVAQNLQYQAGAQQRLQGALGMMAEEEDRQFQINEFAPYADRIRLSEDLIGAGVTNLNSSAGMAGVAGIGEIGGAATSAGTLGGAAHRGALNQFVKYLVNSIYLP